MRVLVCGGRDYVDQPQLWGALDNIHRKDPINVLIEGGARGADQLAKEWAQANSVCVMEFPANWNIEGPPAGTIRNNRMLKYGQPDMVVAFPTPGSKGTWHMVSRAKIIGLRLAVYENNQEEEVQ